MIITIKTWDFTWFDHSWPSTIGDFRWFTNETWDKPWKKGTNPIGLCLSYFLRILPVVLGLCRDGCFYIGWKITPASTSSEDLRSKIICLNRMVIFVPAKLQSNIFWAKPSCGGFRQLGMSSCDKVLQFFNPISWNPPLKQHVLICKVPEQNFVIDWSTGITLYETMCVVVKIP